MIHTLEASTNNNEKTTVVESFITIEKKIHVKAIVKLFITLHITDDMIMTIKSQVSIKL